MDSSRLLVAAFLTAPLSASALTRADSGLVGQLLTAPEPIARSARDLTQKPVSRVAVDLDATGELHDSVADFPKIRMAARPAGSGIRPAVKQAPQAQKYSAAAAEEKIPIAPAQDGSAALRSLAAYLHMFSMARDTAEGWQDAKDPVWRGAAFFLETAKNFRQIARLEMNLKKETSGRLNVHPEALSLGDLMKHVAKLRQAEAARSGKTLTLRLPDQETSVFADKAAVLVLLDNLIGNAIALAPISGKITLGYSSDPAKPGLATVFVEDSSRGPMDLSLVKRLVASMDGRLQVKIQPSRNRH